MSIQEKRKVAFEEYALAHPYLREISFKRNDSHPDECDDPELDLAWEAWNAALDTVLIDLPGIFIQQPQEMYPTKWMLHAIESAGLKVKS